MKVYPTNSRVLVVPEPMPTYGTLGIPVMNHCLYGRVIAVDMQCGKAMFFSEQRIFFQNLTGNNEMYDNNGHVRYLIDYRDIIATVEE